MPLSPVMQGSLAVLQECTSVSEALAGTDACRDMLQRIVDATGADAAELTLACRPDLSVRVAGRGPQLSLASHTFPAASSRTGPVHSTDHGIEITVMAAQDRVAPASSIVMLLRTDPVSPLEHYTLLAETLRTLLVALEKEDDLQREINSVQRFRDLYELGEDMASTLDLDRVLQRSTQRVAEVLGAEAGTLFLVDPSADEVVFKVAAGPAEDLLLEQRMPADKGIAGWVISKGLPVRVDDVKLDPRFYGAIDQLTGFRTRSVLCVPLRVKGKTIGALEVVNKHGNSSFTEDDERWLSILAPLVAETIENASLYGSLRAECDRIVVAEEGVRRELARNLHDGPAQILAALILNIDIARRRLTAGPDQMAAELDFLESLAREANHEVRSLLFSLRPLTLETHGLSSAVSQLVERMLPRVSYDAHVEVSELSDGAMVPSVAGMLFVIIQEALNNVHKHANATNVWIRLIGEENQLLVEVIDDGVGFDVKSIDANYGQLNSFGLLNMRERARLINSLIEICSPPPDRLQGTLVRLRVPLGASSHTP